MAAGPAGCAIDGLRPAAVWRHFAELCARPHGSGNEGAVADYVLGVARGLGLSARRDGIGNVLVVRPASAGREAHPGVVLQGHLDMVCEKNADTAHDFATDPIRLLRDGEWVTAEGTTLGADNGIGVAMALAVMEDRSLSLPPTEYLFTVDEETGLNGALNLESGAVRGALLLNLDSEDEGVVYIGCAGGQSTTLTLAADREPAPEGLAFRVRVAGLRGGHSGLDIHEGRGNAIRILARLLWEVRHLVDVADLAGGRMHNAIPREAGAVVVVPELMAQTLLDRVTEYAATVKAELGAVDPGVTVTASDADVPATVLTGPTVRRLLGFLYAVPNGVAAMSHALPCLVETSSNLATVKVGEATAEVLTSQRSAIASGLADLSARVAAAGELAGFEVERSAAYPSWPPNPDSQLLGLFREVHGRLRGSPPEVKAVHAGLECGIIGERCPGMDMISFGPDIRGAHSPGERVHAGSVERTFELLLAILAEIR